MSNSMTVAQLIERLQQEDPTALVGAATECCGCSGTDAAVEVERGIVWIVDKRGVIS